MKCDSSNTNLRSCINQQYHLFECFEPDVLKYYTFLNYLHQSSEALCFSKLHDKLPAMLRALWKQEHAIHDKLKWDSGIIMMW